MPDSHAPEPNAHPYLAWVRKEIASHPKLYTCFQLVFFCWAIVWWIFPPTADKVLLVLGVLAIVVTIQPQMTDAHRLSWMVIMIALFIVAFKSINKDHADYDRKQAEIRQKEKESFAAILKQDQDHFEATFGSLKSTVSGLQTVITNSDAQFKATMKRSDRIVSGIGDAMRMQTGGDSFAYIMFTVEPAYVTFEGFSNPSGPYFLITVTSHGKYPLREVHATIIDRERLAQALKEHAQHPEGDFLKATRAGDTPFQMPYLRPQSPEAPSGDVKALGTYPIPLEDAKDLTIAFSSLNGYWNEKLHLRRINGRWVQALSVVGPTAKQAIKPFIYYDSDWPEGKALTEKDWPRITPTNSSNHNLKNGNK